ncbi:hypothetical protein NBRC3280_3107 [Acetobacter pasteurianus NBRC 3280]|uniref:Uncharacterized protein n=1 Tax=Acetobacter pasteurianus NBRC 3278 TaxID=1226660 RepID=A0A401X824_ACEPA|nr:hypothetical protein [Acetobacter pasteurianus]GCD60448.1 hypothetical protein NBRC3277_3023 [Acetobacter pasteurianus NBRC 3277]GCD64065.1 hypothetical protein NBRC3278_3158 [Acetobacter pasteurianus NBRC 3278]GCD70472.1 hypothetical protein NBRC3280_3107 [Acetobacter pasteurianus NBRC 3280]
MAKVLTPSDLAGVCQKMIDSPDATPEQKKGAKKFLSELENTMQFGSEMLAYSFGVDCRSPDMHADRDSLGGYLCATISVAPHSENEPIPSELKDVDPEGDWEPFASPLEAPSP